MEDKSVLQIIGEILLGVLFTIPFIVSETNSYAHITWIEVTFRLLYSFGIPIIIVKLLSLCYRGISILCRNLLAEKDSRYFLMWFLFAVMGFVLWYRYLYYFEKGYIWAEIIGYVVASFWFLLDVNTTRCSRALTKIVEKLGVALKIHMEFVENYKLRVDHITEQKKQAIRDMDQFYENTRFGNPRKPLNQDLNTQYVDQYLDYIPLYDMEYKGVEGFLDGMMPIRKYSLQVDKYVEDLEEDRKWMEKEVEIYNEQVDNIEKGLNTLKKSKEEYLMVENAEGVEEHNKECYRERLQRESAITMTIIQEINDVWKVNKKINKARRRKHYGR